MPSWAQNHWQIQAEPQDADTARELFSVLTEPDEDHPEQRRVTFNKMIPMPEILQRAVWGFCRVEDQEMRLWMEETDDEGETVRRALTHEECVQVRQTGYGNWFDWACDNWGTKWDACEGEATLIDNDTGVVLQLEFNTAWHPPREVIKMLVDDYPELRFVATHYSETSNSISTTIHSQGRVPDDDRDEYWSIPEAEIHKAALRSLKLISWRED